MIQHIINDIGRDYQPDGINKSNKECDFIVLSDAEFVALLKIGIINLFMRDNLVDFLPEIISMLKSIVKKLGRKWDGICAISQMLDNQFGAYDKNIFIKMIHEKEIINEVNGEHNESSGNAESNSVK